MGNRRHRQREPGALNGKELAATIPQRTATEPLFAAAREAREQARRGGAPRLTKGAVVSSVQGSL
jgi:hypothetical protein